MPSQRFQLMGKEWETVAMIIQTIQLQEDKITDVIHHIRLQKEESLEDHCKAFW